MHTSPRRPARCLPYPLVAVFASAVLCACSITDGDSNADSEDSSSSNTSGETTETGGGGTDSDSDPSAGPTDSGSEGDEVTIPMIRQGMVTEGALVTVKDVIVTGPLRAYGTDDKYSQAYLGDPAGGQWSGIYLFTYKDVADMGLSLAVGEQVTVTGVYSEFNSVSQITLANLGDLTKNGTAPVPAPTPVSAAALASEGTGEPYESVLVQLDDATVVDDSLGYGDFLLNDGATLNNQYLFEAGEDFNPSNGDTFDSLIGPVGRDTFDPPHFYIAPRDWDDIIGWSDGGNTTDPTGGDATPATIYEVQQGDHAEGTIVELKDVVVSTPASFNGSQFYVQESAGGAWSGISVYLDAVDHPGLAVGDTVDIVGEYTEYFDMSQITVTNASDIVMTGSGAAPTPEVLSPADCMLEDWEGVLARVENVVVTVDANNMYFEWEVDGLVMDKQFFADADWPKPSVNDAFSSITGVLRFAFDKRRMAPRDANDIAP